MDSLDGSITVNQVFCAKYAPISGFLLKKRKEKKRKKKHALLNREITRKIQLDKWESSGTHLYILCLVMNFAHLCYSERLLLPELSAEPCCCLPLK